jgi:hypothetical protein
LRKLRRRLSRDHQDTDVGEQVIFRLVKEGDVHTVTELQIPAFKDRSDPGWSSSKRLAAGRRAG